MIPNCEVCGETVDALDAVGLAIGTMFKNPEGIVMRLDIKTFDPRNPGAAIEWVHRQCLDVYFDSKFSELEARVDEVEELKEEKPKFYDALGGEMED